MKNQNKTFRKYNDFILLDIKNLNNSIGFLDYS